MAQTTDQNTFVDAHIEFSDDGSAWDDISGFSSEIALSGGDRNSGEVYTAEGDTPIIGAGKRTPIDVEVTVVYTEGTADPFETVRALYETDGGGDAYLQWVPRGDTVGNFMFTTGKGIITSFMYPNGPVEPGDPQTVKFTLKVPAIAKSTYST